MGASSFAGARSGARCSARSTASCRRSRPTCSSSASEPSTGCSAPARATASTGAPSTRTRRSPSRPASGCSWSVDPGMAANLCGGPRAVNNRLRWQRPGRSRAPRGVAARHTCERRDGVPPALDVADDVRVGGRLAALLVAASGCAAPRRGAAQVIAPRDVERRPGGRARRPGVRGEPERAGRLGTLPGVRRRSAARRARPSGRRGRSCARAPPTAPSTRASPPTAAA